MTTLNDVKHNTQHIINDQQISEMPPRYRAQLINSLSGFKSANLIGSIDTDGRTNVAIFSSVVHLGASPALVGFVVRPDTAARHTLENIKQTKQYTINQVSDAFWQSAHQTSARYKKHQSEFDYANLDVEFLANIEAPFVKQSQLKYGLELKELLPIKLNGTFFVIGEIKSVVCNPNAIKKDGYIDIESLNTVSISGLDSYHTTERLCRVSYAKPDQIITPIPLDGE